MGFWIRLWGKLLLICVSSMTNDLGGKKMVGCSLVFYSGADEKSCALTAETSPTCLLSKNTKNSALCKPI